MAEQAKDVSVPTLSTLEERGIEMFEEAVEERARLRREFENATCTKTCKVARVCGAFVGESGGFFCKIAEGVLRMLGRS